MERAKAEAHLFKTTVGILSGPGALEQSSSSNSISQLIKDYFRLLKGKYMSRDQSTQIGKNKEMFQLSHNQCCIPCLRKQWGQE